MEVTNRFGIRANVLLSDKSLLPTDDSLAPANFQDILLDIYEKSSA